MSSCAKFGSTGGGGGGSLQTLSGDTGGVVTPNFSGDITIAGDGSILTTIGNLSFNTLTLELIPGTNGQLIIGSSSGYPEWATLTAGSGISITNGANSIEISATSSGVTLTGDTGGVVDPDGSGNFDLVGDGAILTTVGNLSANTMTFQLVPGSDGQLIIGATSGYPAWSTLTAGPGITVTNGSNSIEIEASGAHQYTQFTSDATPTAIITITDISGGGYAVVTAQVSAAQTGGGGSGGNGGGGTITFVAGNALQTGNVSEILGTPSIMFTATSALGLSATADPISGDVFINVIGVAAENYNWTATYQIVVT